MYNLLQMLQRSDVHTDPNYTGAVLIKIIRCYTLYKEDDKYVEYVQIMDIGYFVDILTGKICCQFRLLSFIGQFVHPVEGEGME